MRATLSLLVMVLVGGLSSRAFSQVATPPPVAPLAQPLVAPKLAAPKQPLAAPLPLSLPQNSTVAQPAVTDTSPADTNKSPAVTNKSPAVAPDNVAPAQQQLNDTPVRGVLNRPPANSAEQGQAPIKVLVTTVPEPPQPVSANEPAPGQGETYAPKQPQAPVVAPVQAPVRGEANPAAASMPEGVAIQSTAGGPALSAGSLIGHSFPPPPALDSAGGKQGDNSLVPGQILVSSPSLEEAEAVAQWMQSLGARIKTRRQLGQLGMVLSVFRLPEGQSVNEVLAQLRSAQPEWWVDGNQRYRPLGDEALRMAGQTALGWQPQHGACSAGMRLGMIDGAIDPAHPALQGAALEARHFYSGQPGGREHATAVASLWLGRGAGVHGVLPQARVFAAEVFSGEGKRQETTSEQVLFALDWLVEMNVQLINLSFGGERNLIVELALQRVAARNVALVAAAGNGGPQAAPVYPAAHEGVVAVTAVDAKLRAYKKAQRGDYIDLAAPGVDLWLAADKGGGFRSGSSFAAPLAAAALLVALGRQPYAQWGEHFSSIARDLGEPGRDAQFGWGLIQWPAAC